MTDFLQDFGLNRDFFIDLARNLALFNYAFGIVIMLVLIF